MPGLVWHPGQPQGLLETIDSLQSLSLGCLSEGQNSSCPTRMAATARRTLLDQDTSHCSGLSTYLTPLPSCCRDALPPTSCRHGARLPAAAK